jgi:hypothetical protein
MKYIKKTDYKFVYINMQIITMGKAAIFKSKISNILQKKLDWKMD